MSKELGPIHFKMYNKIGKQEELTREIAAYAEGKGWIEDAGAFTKELAPLEEVIDLGNIHGWIQGQIDEAESRFAGLVKGLVEADGGRLEEILGIAFDFGRKYGMGGAMTAPDAYIRFANLFLNGMPCDKVNYAVAEDDTLVNWELRQDVHARYWDGDAAVFYRIRKRVMDGMLEGTSFSIEMKDELHYVITRREKQA